MIAWALLIAAACLTTQSKWAAAGYPAFGSFDLGPGVWVCVGLALLCYLAGNKRESRR